MLIEGNSIISYNLFKMFEHDRISVNNVNNINQNSILVNSNTSFYIITPKSLNQTNSTTIIYKYLRKK